MTIVSFAVLGLAVGACGQQTNDTDQAGSPTKVTTAPPSNAVPVPTMPSGGASGGPVKPNQDVTVEGVIEKGVEPGCYVLTPTDQNGPKYLVLVKTEPPLGVPVTVKGRTSNAMSYCQQGTPLEVSQVDRK